MTFEELKEKALRLPLQPGVYIMRDKTDRVIYVGKAKKLKNRVTQYFQDTLSHTPKTRLMVSHIDHFDVIVAQSEFEALVLECSLIKRHMPKYNILLKDDKGYPYIRLDDHEFYPRLTMVAKPAKDLARYYGPYGSRSVTKDVITAISQTLKLPECSRQFPRDIGKNRPCLNYHMNRCAGWCREESSRDDYIQAIEQAKQLLGGNFKEVSAQIRQQMLTASDRLEFELAASLRDRLNAVEALGQRQLVTALSMADTDAVGYAQTETKACLAVLHLRNGNLLDKDYEVFPVPEDQESAVSSLLKQYYLSRGMAPKRVLLPFQLEDAVLFSQLLEQDMGIRTKFLVPQRGDSAKLMHMACTNALEEAERLTDREERVAASLILLGKMLSLAPPKRIESFDISNISGTDIVASMVVWIDGKPSKRDYKHFKVEGLSDQDDYASMRQVVYRRFAHYVQGDTGFSEKPDLLLIDGGVNHANIALQVLQELSLDIPVFGMVKDDRHRTRSLVSPQGKEIGIDANQTVFALIGSIQEETHRFAISYHRKLRSKRLQYSQLDSIVGIGPKRKQDLLKTFRSISAIRQASLEELVRVLPSDAATAVYRYFHGEESLCGSYPDEREV